MIDVFGENLVVIIVFIGGLPFSLIFFVYLRSKYNFGFNLLF
jgi:hypothetical protein